VKHVKLHNYLVPLLLKLRHTKGLDKLSDESTSPVVGDLSAKQC